MDKEFETNLDTCIENAEGAQANPAAAVTGFASAVKEEAEKKVD